jgi:hypothetical protein
MGAKSSAVGYLAIKRQAGLDSPTGGADMTTGATGSGNPRYFLKARNLKFSQMPESTRYREIGGGGRDIALELKEGITQDPEFEVFARPVVAGFLAQAMSGPSTKTYATQSYGGGQVSNGFVRRPSASTVAFSTTLSASVDAGVATLMLADSPASLAANDWLAIGWGPTLEFFQSAGIVGVGAVPVACPISTGPPIQVLQYPHVKGEPIMRCKAVAWLAADTVGTQVDPMVLTVPTPLGSAFAIGRKVAIGAVQNVNATTSGGSWGDPTLNGAEFGGCEEINTSAATATTATTITLVAAGTLKNKHSKGAWVYDVGLAADTVPTTGMIHCFEPMTSLDGENDYFSLARAVSTALFEQVCDAKSNTFSIVGEAKKPLNIKCMFPSRYGKSQAAALTESYTNQQIADLPFLYQHGKFFVKIGTDVELSSKMFAFDFMVDNKCALDIFTDSTTRDEVKDLAREMEISPKFYFQSGAAYNNVIYGGSNPSNGALPSPNMATGYISMDFRIDDYTRMGIWIPSITWSGFPVEVDPEPKPLTVDAKCTPLKSGNLPVFLMAVMNKELGQY